MRAWDGTSIVGGACVGGRKGGECANVRMCGGVCACVMEM